MDPYELMKRDAIEKQSDDIASNMSTWSKYDICRMYNDLDDFIKSLDDAALTRKQRQMADSISITVSKIFLRSKD